MRKLAREDDVMDFEDGEDCIMIEKGRIMNCKLFVLQLGLLMQCLWEMSCVRHQRHRAKGRVVIRREHQRCHVTWGGYVALLVHWLI